MKITEHFWAVINKHGNIVKWYTLSDGDEGLEIHRTRKLCRGAIFKHAGERVVKVEVTHEM